MVAEQCRTARRRVRRIGGWLSNWRVRGSCWLGTYPVVTRGLAVYALWAWYIWRRMAVGLIGSHDLEAVGGLVTSPAFLGGSAFLAVGLLLYIGWAVGRWQNPEVRRLTLENAQLRDALRDQEKRRRRATQGASGCGCVGAIIGAIVGGSLGIAAGPFGAIAGTVPCAILGGALFALLGRLFGEGRS